MGPNTLITDPDSDPDSDSSHTVTTSRTSHEKKVQFTNFMMWHKMHLGSVVVIAMSKAVKS